MTADARQANQRNQCQESLSKQPALCDLRDVCTGPYQDWKTSCDKRPKAEAGNGHNVPRVYQFELDYVVRNNDSELSFRYQPCWCS